MMDALRFEELRNDYYGRLFDRYYCDSEAPVEKGWISLTDEELAEVVEDYGHPLQDLSEMELFQVLEDKYGGADCESIEETAVGQDNRTINFTYRLYD